MYSLIIQYMIHISITLICIRVVNSNSEPGQYSKFLFIFSFIEFNVRVFLHEWHGIEWKININYSDNIIYDILVPKNHFNWNSN